MRTTDRLRVLMLLKTLGAGGAERLVSLSARLGDRTAFDYEVAYLLPWKRDLVAELEDADVPVHCLRGGREWDLRWASRLRGLLRERQIDVLHVHSPYVAGIARLVVRSMPRDSRPAMIYTEHLPWFGHKRLTRLLNACTYPLDDAQVAVSDAVRDSIPPALRKRLSVVLYGIPLDTVTSTPPSRAEVREELGVRDDEILLVTVAHYRPQKGYPDLLQAARLVLDAGVPARFIAIGDGPLEGEILSQHTALGLGDRFQLLGRRHDVLRILSGCDLFVLPSLYEGLPVAVMEALAMGLPIVATTVPSIEQAVTDGREGVLVPPASPGELATAIIGLAADPERRARMSEAGRERGREFDIARTLRTIEALYVDEARTRSAGVHGARGTVAPPRVEGEG